MLVDDIDPALSARAYAPPGGETFEDVRTRVAEAIDELRGSEGRTLIVTHAGPLHATLSVLFGEVSIRFEPASITCVTFERNVAQLTTLGITARQYAERKQASPAWEE